MAANSQQFGTIRKARACGICTMTDHPTDYCPTPQEETVNAVGNFPGPPQRPVGERKQYVIEERDPNEPGANAPRADKDMFKKHLDDMIDVGCLMLATMTPELQKQHEDMVAYEMIHNLKEIYEGQVDDKGDVSAETTGPAPAEVSAGTQISTERLAVLLAYP
ncbi:hypothetical protein V6N12_010465 [Hibiscus sabdariffa]|uniref:Uncharacterized protein n=1 Tax=Hibiscus sabdariffa TaxID=183260 RepID=A0ABR2EMJ2_9ROSI